MDQMDHCRTRIRFTFGDEGREAKYLPSATAQLSVQRVPAGSLRATPTALNLPLHLQHVAMKPLRTSGYVPPGSTPKKLNILPTECISVIFMDLGAFIHTYIHTYIHSMDP